MKSFFRVLTKARRIWSAVTMVAGVISDLDKKIDLDDGLSLEEALVALRMIRWALKPLGVLGNTTGRKAD
jgi:hypothetical protein